MKRVVVTGFGCLTAFGNTWTDFKSNVDAGKNAVTTMPDWDRFEGLNTRLAAPLQPPFNRPEHYSRKDVRSMSAVSVMSTRATEIALLDANLLNDPMLRDGRCGIAYGSSTGSTDEMIVLGNMLAHSDMSGVNATTYIKSMGHTTAVNVGVFFGLKGRMHTTSSACTSSSQALGYAYEAIKYGKQKIMVAGGAEALCPSEAVVFDTLYATSTKNESPSATPRPFDRDRDGLVIGEGAGTFILEELEHAQARGAKIHAELVGFGTNTDGVHVTQPTAATMEVAMRLALEDAHLSADAIGYVNAHGTATDRGDIAESQATSAVFGKLMPISSLKSYLGHTLGACGAIEAWASIHMMNDNWFAPTVNLDNVDPECGALDYIQFEPRELEADYVMSNNFAFGGINTSLIFKRWNK
ncbi:3-oxoacyl-ACP synthase [Pseudidiomarina salinarum]|uniref:3-oxoacyl-ACP synthase n=1 Tax=Pseudidiomarina salinarum TaxID=435908 RepID=A0A094IUR9_9GAMM|nr:beta-ketoacyl-ACP synthase [Pseudidiomarina salinarum]KFZ30847.1 3-oxoacyl-ACP synthase [Pseudidiomarina salinarum]RUO71319.1 beta-ketoacyl-ACP synthase II [Pseudidiomarina salinarum]